MLVGPGRSRCVRRRAALAGPQHQTWPCRGLARQPCIHVLV